MQISITMPRLATLAELEEDLARVVLPFLRSRGPEFRRRVIDRIEKRGTATDTEREWPLPRYSKTTVIARRKLGLSSKVDYVRTGTMLRSLKPGIKVDKETGGLVLWIRPTGRMVNALHDTDTARASRRRARKKKHKQQRVKVVGGFYLRKGYKYRRKGHKGSITVPDSWIKLPPEDPTATSARTSKSGIVFHKYYEARRREAEKKKSSRSGYVPKYNRDLAWILGLRLGGGKWLRGGRKSRPTPFVQFSPDDVRAMREAFDREVLPALAEGLWRDA